MDPTAAKYIGAGIACIGMGGAGVGVGIIFGNYLAAALRNPSAADGQFEVLLEARQPIAPDPYLVQSSPRFASAMRPPLLRVVHS